MKKNRLILGAVIIGLVASMTGCYERKEYCDIDMHKDNTGTISTKFYINKKAYDSYVKNMLKTEFYEEDDLETELTNEDKTVEVVDGVKYYCTTRSMYWSNAEEQKEAFQNMFGAYGNVNVSATGFYFVYDKSAWVLPEKSENDVDWVLEENVINYLEYADALQNSFIDVNVSFEDEILHTNGTLSGDKKTASFHLAYEFLKEGTNVVSAYAETSDSEDIEAVDKETPVISGIKEGALVKKFKIKVKDNKKIAGVIYNNYMITPQYGENEIEVSAFTKNFMDGPVELYAVDFAGNISKVINFSYDKTAPMVSGVKNGKTYKKAVKIIYCDMFGVKSATINGKKLKNGQKVSKKGSYTVKVVDKVGNVRKISFKIK
ncbi:MAG: hypothetical protein II838_07995 [Lachnospiraceae bacterium]|jgi:hypothetical protein|nr:hypothetical protein [Lachnospiraceae bacterium]